MTTTCSHFYVQRLQATAEGISILPPFLSISKVEPRNSNLIPLGRRYSLQRPLLILLALTVNLERRIGILDQHLKVLLEPLPRLRSRNVTRIRRAIDIIPHSLLIRSSIRLPTGLNPDESIEQLAPGIRRGADAETGVLYVAPGRPALAAGGLGAGAARVDDEVGGKVVFFEVGDEGFVEFALVGVGVFGCVCGGFSGVVLGAISMLET